MIHNNDLEKIAIKFLCAEIEQELNEKEKELEELYIIKYKYEIMLDVYKSVGDSERIRKMEEESVELNTKIETTIKEFEYIKLKQSSFRSIPKVIQTIE